MNTQCGLHNFLQRAETIMSIPKHTSLGGGTIFSLFCATALAGAPPAPTAADVLRQATKQPVTDNAIFRVDSEDADAFVSPEDVRNGLNRFDEQDVISELIENHPLISCAGVATLIGAITLIQTRKRSEIDRERPDVASPKPTNKLDPSDQARGALADSQSVWRRTLR